MIGVVGCGAVVLGANAKVEVVLEGTLGSAVVDPVSRGALTCVPGAVASELGVVSTGTVIAVLGVEVMAFGAVTESGCTASLDCVVFKGERETTAGVAATVLTGAVMVGDPAPFTEGAAGAIGDTTGTAGAGGCAHEASAKNSPSAKIASLVPFLPIT